MKEHTMNAMTKTKPVAIKKQVTKPATKRPNYDLVLGGMRHRFRTDRAVEAYCVATFATGYIGHTVEPNGAVITGQGYHIGWTF